MRNLLGRCGDRELMWALLALVGVIVIAINTWLGSDLRLFPLLFFFLHPCLHKVSMPSPGSVLLRLSWLSPTYPCRIQEC